MGVFARLFRRSRTADGATAAEEPADVTASGPESVHSEVGGSPADAGAGEEATKAGDGGGEDAAGTGSGAADGVEIPKQQSADEVAEQETGKGART